MLYTVNMFPNALCVMKQTTSIFDLVQNTADIVE